MRYLIIFSLLIVFSKIGAQTYHINGSIKDLPSSTILYVQLEVFDGNAYQKKGISIVEKSGIFQVPIKEISDFQTARLCFNSGDTILCILGEKNSIEMDATWKYGKIAEHSFRNSIENEAFELVKKQIKQLKKKEDSLGYTGMEIHEFDPQYLKKSNSLKQIHQEIKANYNSKLDIIASKYPDTYTSQSIIPIIKVANMIEMKTAAEGFDNNRSFQHYHFFDYIDANNVYITTHPFLEKKITEYMNLWVSQQDKGLQEGIDLIMEKFSGNEIVSKYCLGILINYFTERNNYPLLDYINSKHINSTTCEAPNLSGKSAEVMAQMKRLAKGNPAPELIMPDVNGNMFQLSTFKPNKKLVLFFWASWCPHCTEMMPKVIEFYNNEKPTGTEFIAISLDDRKEDWLTFIQANKLPWKNISDLKKWNSEVIKTYALRGTPTFYILDTDLHIIGRTNDLDELKLLIK